MGIIKILAGTVVKVVYGVILTVGVLFEGTLKLLGRIGDDLVKLDKKIITAGTKKKQKPKEEPKEKEGVNVL